MEIKRETTAVQRARADLLAVPLRAGVEVSAEIAALDLATGGRLLREVRQRSADPARRGCVSVYQTHGELPAELIARIGVGKAPADGSLPIDEWRRFAGAALGAAQAARARVACVSVGSARPADAAIAAGSAAIEGALLATYRFEGYRRPNPAKRVERVVVLGMPRSSAADAAARRAVAVAEATCLARDLVNTPAEDATPAHLGRVAERMARRGGLHAKIFAPRELRRFGMGAILGVGRGSRNEPRLIEMI